MGLFDFLGKKKEVISPYTQRVPYKNQRYFEKFIQIEQEDIDLAIQDFKDNKIPPEQIRFANGSILSDGLRKMIAMYSSGRPVEQVRNEYLKMIEFFEKGCDKDVYEPVKWMVSLGILLEIEDAQFDRLVSALDKQQFQDYLIDFLIAYRKPNRAIAATLLFPEHYKAIQEIVTLPKPEAEQRLRIFLEKEWYQGSRDCYWYNDHTSEFDVYFGYWSFEAGAIAKILRLDDNSFKDNEYYPYDLVHWKEARQV